MVDGGGSRGEVVTQLKRDTFQGAGDIERLVQGRKRLARIRDLRSPNGPSGKPIADGEDRRQVVVS